MADLLFASTPAAGHVGPMLQIAAAAQGRGHTVRFLTGSNFEDPVRNRGLKHRALAGGADFDHADVDAAFPGRRSKRGVAKLRFDVDRVFVETVPPQFDSLRAEIGQRRPDVVVVDNAFAGAIPLLTGSPEWSGRPAVVAIGVLPMMISSADVAPWGLGMPPSRARVAQLRNRGLNLLVQRGVFGAHQRKLERMLSDRFGYPRLGRFIFDWPLAADALLQLTVERFEYPRRGLPETVRFVGPVLPVSTVPWRPPRWWPELEDGRPVAVVTQGTVDNQDLGRLVGPTLEALSGEELLVVAVTGGRPTKVLGELPKNVRASEFIPFDLLMPKTSLFVTNGGYGGVHFALAHAVPLVVAGDTEDKPEVAARVAWARCGVDLRTGTPTAGAIADAVRRTIADPPPGLGSMARDIGKSDGVASVLDTVERLVP